MNNQIRDRVLKLLNITLIEAELKMTLENKDKDIHHFANTVFNRMLNKMATEK